MLKRFLTIYVILIVSLLPTVSFAGGQGSVEISPFIGIFSYEHWRDVVNKTGASIRMAPVYGIRLGYNLTDHTGIEGSAEFIGSNSDFRNNLKIVDKRPPYGHLNATIYRADLLYNFYSPENRFRPFVAIGPGIAHFSPSGSNDFSDRFLINYGAGFKYALKNNVSFRMDARHIMTFTGRPYNNFEAAAGLTLSFGGRTYYKLSPEERARLQKAIQEANRAKAAAERSDASERKADNASEKSNASATRAEESANKAEAAAKRAEESAKKAAVSAEKGVESFEKSLIK